MTNMNLYDPGEFHVNGFFDKILKADKGHFVIAGYAYPILEDQKGRIRGDREGDSISLTAMDKGYTRMMARVARRNLMGYHSNVQIGELLVEFTDEKGVLWKGGVIFTPNEQYPKKGLFIIADVFGDINEGRRYRTQMEMGNMLAFSVGGESLHRTTICNEGFCRSEIDDMNLSEVSACQVGINPEAKAFILKSIPPNSPRILALAKSGASLLTLLHAR